MPSISSLLRSAESARKKQKAYEDSVQYFEWQNSAQTDDDYNKYSSYLKDRRDTIGDPSEQLTIQTKLRSAERSYQSNVIQRAQQQVMQGNYSLQEKEAVVTALFDRSVAMGDINQAQNLLTQLNSISVQIQNQQIQAQAAAERLQKAETTRAKDVGKGYKSMASEVIQGMEDLTRAYEQGGQLEYNKEAKKFVDGARPFLKEMGIDLPEDYSTNIGQLLLGMQKAVMQFNDLASQALQFSDPEGAQEFQDKNVDIASGKTTFNTPIGKLTMDQTEAFATQQTQFIESVGQDELGNTTKKMVASTVRGYMIDENGKLRKIATGRSSEKQFVEGADGKVSIDEKQLRKQLEQAGFDPNYIQWSEDKGVYKVQITDAVEEWMDPEILGVTRNSELYLEPSETGFQYVDPGNDRLFNISFDKKGLAGLYEVKPFEGLTHVTGQYGFDQSRNTAKEFESVLYKPRQWVAPMQTQEQQAKQALEKDSPAFTSIINNRPPSGAMNLVTTAMNALNARKQSANMTQRAGGGYDFTDANGRPISAYTYAQQKGTGFRDVLGQMAKTGDTYASQALNYAGNDGAYNPATVPLSVSNNWQSLIWGSNVKTQKTQASRVAGTSDQFKFSDPTRTSIFGGGR